MRYWKRIESAGTITTVESYSHNAEILGAVEIKKSEFDAYISSLPVKPPVIVRDYGKELDELTAKLRAKGIV